MIFYQLEDLDRMLGSTADPIADMINASCSDTVQYCSKLTYEEFVNSTSNMNDLSTYAQLTERSNAIGYKVVQSCLQTKIKNDKYVMPPNADQQSGVSGVSQQCRLAANA